MKARYLAVPLLGLTLAAHAAEPRKDAAQQPASAAKSERVCTYETVTGSHLKKRVCMTEQEREQQRRASRDSATALDRKQSGLRDRKGYEGR
jgi:hypothetical protein